MSLLLMNERSTAPDAPSSGKRFIYPKSDGWYQKDAAGNEIKITGATNIDELLDVDITTPANGDLLIYNSSTSKWENIQTDATVHGCSMTHDERMEYDTNSTSDYKDYLEIEPSACVTGKDYRIGVTACWNMSNASRNIQMQLEVDGNQIGLLELETKDTGADIRNWTSSFFYFPASAASHTLTLSYRPENSSDTARMYYAGLEWWRTEL